MNRIDVFLGGVPTEPDIRAIREAYPDHTLEVGQIIPYEALEKIIGKPRRSYRFQSVTTRWRKLVEEEMPGIVIGAVANRGYRVEDDLGKLGLARSKMSSAARALHRSIVVAGRVDRKALDEDATKRLDHLQKVQGSAAAGMQLRGLPHTAENYGI